MSGLWSTGRLFSGLAILVLFFAPWMEVSCDGKAVARVSGYHLAWVQGSASQTEMPQPMPGKLSMGVPSGDAPLSDHLPGAHAPGALVLWIFPIGALLMVVWGLTRGGGPSRLLGGYLLAATLVGLALAIQVLWPWPPSGGPPGAGVIDTRLAWGFWATLALGGLWACLEWSLSEESHSRS